MKSIILTSMFILVLCGVSYSQTSNRNGSTSNRNDNKTNSGKTGGQTSGKTGGQTSGGRQSLGKIDISTPSNSGGRQTPSRNSPSNDNKTKVEVMGSENGKGVGVKVSKPF